jgi:hypothetical protein
MRERRTMSRLSCRDQPCRLGLVNRVGELGFQFERRQQLNRLQEGVGGTRSCPLVRFEMLDAITHPVSLLGKHYSSPPPGVTQAS